MKTASHSFAPFDPLPNVGQALQDKYTCLDIECFPDDLLADCVVDMLDTAGFFARDFLEQLSSRLRTVGLKLAPFCEKLVSFVAGLAPTKEFSAAGCSEYVFPYVDPEPQIVSKGYRMGELDDQVEVPDPLFTDQLCLSKLSLRKKALLKQPHGHGDLDSPLECVKRKNPFRDRIGSFVEVDAFPLVKPNRGDFRIFRKSFCFIGLANRKNCVANHLRSKGKTGPHVRVGQVMQGHPIPAAILDHNRNKTVANREKLLSKGQKLRLLLWSRLQFDADRPFHVAKSVSNNHYIHNSKEQRFLPTLKDRVSALSKR